MDSIQMQEEPLIRKCCFILPLRFCLQTWALLKMIVDFIAAGYLMTVIYMVLCFGDFTKPSGIHIVLGLVIALFMDIGFLITLTAGICMKSYKIIRVFFFYEFFAMVVEASIITFITVRVADKSKDVCILYIIVGVLYLALDLCIILTLKSEMVKLRYMKQHDFSKMQREAAHEEADKFFAEGDAV